MSKINGILELDIALESARRACEKALVGIGFEVIGQDANRVKAREDPTRLCCHQSPAETELAFTGSDDRCQVAIETRVPGFGPISATHARGRQEAIVRHVHRAATADVFDLA